MMVAVFTTLLAAMLLDRLRQRVPAFMVLALCLVLSAWLFQWEVDSPQSGFGMPWLRF